MANLQLYDKSYRIPQDILNHIKKVKIAYPTSNGIKRANNLLSGTITYQGMKRIKHDFETIGGDIIQYNLAGGHLMKQFIDRMLSNDRAAVSREKSMKQPILPNLKYELNPGSLNEDKKEQIKNALCIIVNGDNKILLMKRVEGNYWGGGKWGLVGGRVEKDDKNPEAAGRREVEEESGLILGKFHKRFNIQRDNETEYIFVSRYNGSTTDIKLNEEHSDYGWFGVDEIKKLDTVPHLMEYLVLSFKQYNK